MKEKGEKMLQRFKKLGWPLNLWSAIFQKEITKEELPEDWEAALEHVMDGLESERRKDILKCFFKDGLTIREIGLSYGTTVEPVRQHAEKAIRIMRHPSNLIFLTFGFKNGMKMLARKREDDDGRALTGDPIDVLDLNARSYNSLRRSGIETVEQLVQYTESDLLRFRNLGTRALQDIKNCLAKCGLSLCTKCTGAN